MSEPVQGLGTCNSVAIAVELALADLESGTRSGNSACISQAKISVKSTSTLLPARLLNGSSVRPLDSVAVAHSSTLTESELLQTVNALLSMLVGMLYQQPSEDAFWLAMHYGHRLAQVSGVSETEWARVMEIVKRRYAEERRKNPINVLF